MKKKLGSLFLTLVMGVSALAGCSLVERDDKLYYSAVVATVDFEDGKTCEITKRDLISAYNSYGYNYTQNGMTNKAAINQTLETLINREITIKAVEDYYKKTGEVLFNENETTYLWDETYLAMFENLETYFEEIVETPAEEEEESEAANSSVYVPYSSDVELGYEDVKDAQGNVVGQKLVIKNKTKASTIRENYKARKNASGEYVDFEKNEEDKESLYTKLTSVAVGEDQTARSWKSAINNYVKDIKKNYEFENFETDKDAFMFEIDRVFNILKENYYSEKYTQIYNAYAREGADNSSVSVKDVLKAYSEKVVSDYTTYVLEEGNFDEAIVSDSAKNYISENGNYFNLAYIKFEIDTDLLTELKTQKEAGMIVGETYNAEVRKVYDAAIANIRNSETGELTGQTKEARLLIDEIREVVNAYSYLDVESLSAGQIAEAEELEMTLEEYVADYNKNIEISKAEAFRKYFYLYNADDNYKGQDYNAVFGVSSSGEVIANSTFSEDEDALEAIKSLYDAGNAKVGDISNLVETDDGVYLFFYAGEVVNLFGGINENFDISTQEDAIKILMSTRVNIFSEKTVFDMIYGDLVKDNFSVFENMNINYLRGLAEKIEINTNKIKDLY